MSKNTPPTGVLKIRILPTKSQQQVFKRWLGSYNYTWNKALHHVNSENARPSYVPLKNKFTVMNPIYLLGQSNPDVPDFMVFTPSKIRQYAVRDLCTSFESAKTNKRRGNIGSFTVKNKKKKNQRRSFSIPISKDGICLYDDELKRKCEGKQKAYISIYPEAMMECFTHIKTKPLRNVDYMLNSHLKYKKHVQSDEIWLEYLDFIKTCGVCVTMKQFYLREQNQSLYGMDLWQDYFDYMMEHGFYSSIDSDYKDVYKQEPVEKKKSDEKKKPVEKEKHVPFIRFFHRKHDKLLYSLTIDYDCIIKYEYGMWYIHIPYVKAPRPEPVSTDSIVGLDPGFKTFQTFFSETMHGKIQQTNRFKKLRYLIDYMNTLYYGKKKNRVWISEPDRTRYKNFMFKTNQLYRKQSNLAMQMHYDTIRFLTGKFNWILLPSFNTQEMVKGYKLSRETKREASQLQHYRFKQRLQSACSSMSHCKVLIVSEAYTSKTCGRCGNLKQNLKLVDRIYNCSKCKLKVDRDVNGSRNILLRTIQS